MRTALVVIAVVLVALLSCRRLTAVDREQELRAMAEQSLENWGHHLPMTFEFHETLWQYGEETIAAAAPIPSHPAQHCRIDISPRFWHEEVDQQLVMDHEVGHCLGLQHSEHPENSTMYAVVLGITPLDLLKYRVLWWGTALYRLVVVF